MNDERKTIVIVGGGIAGVSCVEALIHEFNSDKPQYRTIVLISESRLVKKVTNYQLSGRNLERFNVIEGDVEEAFNSKIPEDLIFRPIIGTVTSINHSEQHLIYRDCSTPIVQEKKLIYDILCLCNGSKPKELTVIKSKSCPKIDKRIVVIRDLSTIEDFRDKLSNCRRLVVIGNGGISLELISKISDCEKIWIVRDESIGLAFFDSGAGKFLLDSLTKNEQTTEPGETDKRGRAVMTSLENSNSTCQFGPALGPDWLRNTKLSGACPLTQLLDIIYNDEVTSVTYGDGQDYPLKVTTQSGRNVCCDLIALAIGVIPNKLDIVGGQLDTRDTDGGILIDDQMRTSLGGVYAAGDVVSCSRWPRNDTFFQMRLWTQARQMGFYAGRCIANHILGQDPTIYFNFDCFTHCTQFFGYRVVLLGMYNGQHLSEADSKECEVLARVNPGKDYVKIIIRDNKIVGAVLVGDSGLEETIENLIHDRLDVANLKDHLLDDTVDIEDYFD